MIIHHVNEEEKNLFYFRIETCYLFKGREKVYIKFFDFHNFNSVFIIFEIFCLFLW